MTLPEVIEAVHEASTMLRMTVSIPNEKECLANLEKAEDTLRTLAEILCVREEQE